VRKPQGESERFLVARLRVGDPDAVADLAAAHGARIFQLALRCLRNHEDAQEVTQDVLFRVFRRIHGFRCDSALSSWIHRMTFNAVISRLRRSRRRSQVERCGLGDWALDDNDAARAMAEPIDSGRAPDDAVLLGELRQRLHDAMRRIPRDFRQCLILRDVHGLSTREASRVLRLKPQTVKSRMHRGRRMLRQRLATFDAPWPQKKPL
jgi:RNA polymerase sigma-70 factor (ECF subfamily)